MLADNCDVSVGLCCSGPVLNCQQKQGPVVAAVFSACALFWCRLGVYPAAISCRASCGFQVRAHVESQIALIAAGKADKAAVVEHTLQQFLSKFLFFSENIARMDLLFEANFAPLTASGTASGHVTEHRFFTKCACNMSAAGVS